jgi:hypothetical protein
LLLFLQKKKMLVLLSDEKEAKRICVQDASAGARRRQKLP